MSETRDGQRYYDTSDPLVELAKELKTMKTQVQELKAENVKLKKALAERLAKEEFEQTTEL